MYNILTDVGLKMFSWQHIVAVVISLVIIITVFFLRKYFIKYKTLDLCFRIFLGIALIVSEMIVRCFPPYAEADRVFFLLNFPIPLCNHMLWICGLACLTNSDRIIRLFYPLFLLGATLALIVCDLPHAFPNFATIRYFIGHSGFLLGALYFVWTKKINKFTWKDYGYTCLTISILGAIGATLHALNPELVWDHYMIVEPVPILENLNNPEVLGQFGYTACYMLVVFGIMAVYTLITWLCTRHRKDEDANLPYFRKEYKFLDTILEKTTKKQRYIFLTITVIAFVFIGAVQFKAFINYEDLLANYNHNMTADEYNAMFEVYRTPANIAVGWIAGICFLFSLASFGLNEVLHNYSNWKLRRQEQAIPAQ